MMVQQAPSTDIGHLVGGLLAREQNIGTVRGLLRPKNLILQRRLDLERKLGLVNDNIPDQED